MKWSRFHTKCPSAAVEAVVGLMMEVTGSGPVVEDCEDLKAVSVYVAAGPEAEGFYADLRVRLVNVPDYLSGGRPLALEHTVVQDEDWETAWKEFYHPMRVGRRLVIKPSWEPWPPEGDPDAARPDDLVIELDPEMAFGTGNHATTRLCLEALEDLVQSRAKVLDMGCGSGILSVAAALLGAARVLAADVDRVAVETCGANVARNGQEGVVEVVRGDIDRVEEGGYDLVVANINSPIARAIAPKVFEKLVPGGYYVSSGLIHNAEDDVIAAHNDAGFGVVDVRRDEGWSCIIGRKPE